MELILTGFEAGKFITRSIGRGGPFQGPKVSISKATPFNAPRNGSCLPQNNYVPRHTNNRYIKSYCAERATPCLS